MNLPKLLLADDDADVLRVYHLYLKDTGYELIDARDGEEAVRKYRQYRPDLVVMDICMPGKDGIQAIREIRELDPAANIVVITAHSHYQTNPGLPTLRKAFRKEELINFIARQLRGNCGCGATQERKEDPCSSG